MGAYAIWENGCNGNRNGYLRLVMRNESLFGTFVTMTLSIIYSSSASKVRVLFGSNVESLIFIVSSGVKQ